MELEEMLRAHWLTPFPQRDQSCLIQPWLLCLWFNKLKLQHHRCHSSPGQSKCFTRWFPWCLHQHFQGRTALPVKSSWETSSCKILHSCFCLLPNSVTLLAFPAPLFSSSHPGLKYRNAKWKISKRDCATLPNAPPSASHCLKFPQRMWEH